MGSLYRDPPPGAAGEIGQMRTDGNNCNCGSTDFTDDRDSRSNCGARQGRKGTATAEANPTPSRLRRDTLLRRAQDKLPAGREENYNCGLSQRTTTAHPQISQITGMRTANDGFSPRRKERKGTATADPQISLIQLQLRRVPRLWPGPHPPSPSPLAGKGCQPRRSPGLAQLGGITFPPGGAAGRVPPHAVAVAVAVPPPCQRGGEAPSGAGWGSLSPSPFESVSSV
jgi:hypothetical protein